eukprot:9635752-Alexandrium_andersonii.AAC.1
MCIRDSARPLGHRPGPRRSSPNTRTAHGEAPLPGPRPLRPQPAPKGPPPGTRGRSPAPGGPGPTGARGPPGGA